MYMVVLHMQVVHVYIHSITTCVHFMTCMSKHGNDAYMYIHM